MQMTRSKQHTGIPRLGHEHFRPSATTLARARYGYEQYSGSRNATCAQLNRQALIRQRMLKHAMFFAHTSGISYWAWLAGPAGRQVMRLRKEASLLRNRCAQAVALGQCRLSMLPTDMLYHICQVYLSAARWHYPNAGIYSACSVWNGVEWV